jgi:LL-diaminopimelate aminotransferase
VSRPAPADRLARLPAYPFALINQRVRQLMQQGVDVINLDVGSPDMPPPDFVIEALARAAHQQDKHGYSGYKGAPEFRRAVANYYQRRFGVALDPDTEVLPLIGSKEGIVNLCLAYLDRGDIALVPEISYPAYSMGARMAGAEVCWVPVDEQFLPILEAIPADVLKRAKLLWVNYPNNPTGAAVDLGFYERAAAFCAEHGILLASDNPYVEVTYDGFSACSALQAADSKPFTVEFISLSKSYNMAGWRLGAAVGSAEAVAHLLQIKSNMDSGHFLPIYEAGAAALNDTPQSWIDARNAVYQRRRDLILARMDKIGLTAATPKGSLYIWGKTRTGTGQDYAESALHHAHVSLAPGGIYGPGGGQYVRISLGIADDRLTSALDRLEQWQKN